MPDSTITGLNASKSFDGLIVKSLNDHWSVGGIVLFGSSSYRNEDFRLSLMPGIEYDCLSIFRIHKTSVKDSL